MPFIVSPGGAAFLPGDKQMIVSEYPTSASAGVYLVTIATREIKKLFTVSTIKNTYAQVVLSPDGKNIVYVSRDSFPAAYATLDVSRLVSSKR